MALNLGEKMKIYLQVPTFSIKPQIWLVHVVVALAKIKQLLVSPENKANLEEALAITDKVMGSNCVRGTEFSQTDKQLL